MGCLKCNSDGCRKENLGLSALAFCIRNNEGDLVYAEPQKIGEVSAIAAEIRSVKQGLDDCIQKGCLALTIETYSLITKDILDWVCEVPLIVSIDVRNIKFSMHNMDVEVVHTFKEGNKLVDLLN